MVDFPEPERPTMAIVSPALIRKLTLRKTVWFGREGYEKVTFSSAISPLRGNLLSPMDSSVWRDRAARARTWFADSFDLEI